MLIRKTIGLPNYGNSCYFNACMQILKIIYDHIEVDTNFYDIYYDVNKLKELYIKLSNNEYRQEDCGEILSIFINNLNNITNNFNIKYKRILKCTLCGELNIMNEKREEIDTILISNQLNYKSENDEITFDNMFSNIINKEHVSDTVAVEKFKAEYFKCSCSVNHIFTQVVLLEMPKFLIINVGRYNFVNNTTIIKNTCKLNIVDTFNITTPVNIKEIYNNVINNVINNYVLWGVVLHLGNTTESGHYLCYIKDININKWILCNDSYIEVLENFDINNITIKQNSYLLLYIKTS